MMRRFEDKHFSATRNYLLKCVSNVLFVVDSCVFILNIVLFELAILIKAAYLTIQ